MRSETAQRVVQPRLHSPDRTVDHLRDLREVQAVQVVEHHHEAVLGSELVDGGEHKPAELGLLGHMRRRAVLVRERLVNCVVERGQDDAFPRTPVVRKVDRDAIQPGTQGSVGLETRERAVCTSERVDDDLFRGRGILRDREPEAEDPIAVAIEERVEGHGVAVACRVDQVVVGASVAGRRIAASIELHAEETSGR